MVSQKTTRNEWVLFAWYTTSQCPFFPFDQSSKNASSRQEQEKQLIPHNKRSNPSHRFLEIGQNICIDMALGVLHAIHDSRIASRGRAMNTSRHAPRRRRVVPVCNKLLDRLEICKIALRSYSIPFGVTQHVVHSISLYCHKTTSCINSPQL